VRPQRIHGIDVARAIAILGMVLVNFRGKLSAYASDLAWLEWASNRIEGKPAALFVVLAGIGISLRTRRAREHLRREQVSLLQRAAILFGLGMLMLPLWDWDILHFYGVFLALAALWLDVRDRTLLWLAGFFVAGEVVLFNAFDWWADKDVWSARGAVKNVWFNGLHPVFPWMAFLLLGMWLGRLDLRDPALRRRLILVALALAILAECFDAAARPGDLGKLVDCQWLRTWPRPARPMFVLSGTAIAVVVLCACIELAERGANNRLVLALVATGQLAFTLYVLHAIVIVVSMRVGFSALALELAMIYGASFFAAGVIASVWWRKRAHEGPLEGIIRRVADHQVASRKPS
jgi:uncharacterized protein